jgi:hypothetical protein
MTSSTGSLPPTARAGRRRPTRVVPVSSPPPSKTALRRAIDRLPEQEGEQLSTPTEPGG